MKRKYVLKNKKRFFGFIASVLVLVFIAAFAANVYGYKETQYKIITVKKGDTLWDIASKNCEEGDIRVYIHKIKEINSLPTSDIYYGTKLMLPVKN